MPILLDGIDFNYVETIYTYLAVMLPKNCIKDHQPNIKIVLPLFFRYETCSEENMKLVR